MSADVSPPSVFVSYAHENPEHKERVLRLAELLRDEHAEVVLDVWATATRQDWYSWAIKRITAADYVVVVASPTYRLLGDGAPAGVHRGVQSEVAVLREQVYTDRGTWLPKILPVLLPGHGVDEIPQFLQPNTASNFPVASLTKSGIADLVRVIFGRPVSPKPVDVPTTTSSPHGVVNQVNGTVFGKVLQVDTIHGDVNF